MKSAFPKVMYSACHDNDEFVQLEDFEYRVALAVGREIWRSSQAGGLKDKKPGEQNGMWVQQLGAIAERAGAKLLDVYWPAMIGTFHNADLPHNIEVRLIGEDKYGLRVYNKDIRAGKRVLGIIIPPNKEREPYRCPGWIPAQWAKRNDWEFDPNNKGLPFYAVPQQHLLPLMPLRRLIINELVDKHKLNTNQEIEI